MGLGAAAGVELMEFVQEKCGAKVVEQRDWKSVTGERSVVVLVERSPLSSTRPEDREDEMRNLGMLPCPSPSPSPYQWIRLTKTF